MQDLFTQTLDDGEVIFCEGDDGDCAFIVEVGSVVIWSHRDGDPIELAVIRPGSIFGEMSVIDNVPLMASPSRARPRRNSRSTNRSRRLGRCLVATVIIKCFII